MAERLISGFRLAKPNDLIPDAVPSLVPKWSCLLVARQVCARLVGVAAL